MKLQIKLALAALVFAGCVGSSLTTQAYPPFVKKAAEYGAKDCTFCHTKAEGGEGWNKRGNWLIAEKAKRKADAVDPTWLADYKEAK
jgi:hypothetical protein